MKFGRNALIADLLLLAVSAVWGFTFVAVQRALEGAGPFTFLTVRFSLAALVLLLVFPKRCIRLTGPLVLFSALIGLWLSMGYALQTVGLLYTTASKSAFITGLCVVLVPPISALLARTLPRAGILLSCGLAALGLYFLTSPQGTGFNIGDLLTLGCAFGFALHIVTTERIAYRYDPVPLAFWQIITTAVISGLFVLTMEGWSITPKPWTLVAIVVTGIFATAIAFAIQMWAQQHTSASHVALIYATESVFAAIFGWLIQRDALGWMGLVGAMLIFAGILLAQFSARPLAARS